MSELERQLMQLSRELDWPPTPDLGPAVSTRLRDAAEPAAPARRLRLRGLLPPAGLRRSLALALVALLVLAGGVFAAVPSVRDAVLEFFGLQGATVERLEQLPPAPELRPLRLGERTTLGAARDSLAFDPLVPEAAGRPDGVFVDDRVTGGVLSLAYRPRAGLPAARSTRLGLLVTEFRGDLLPEYTGKIAGQATRIERVRVDGNRAIWLEGAPHFFFYRPPDAPLREERLRIAQNVLLLERGKVLVRLEGAFGLERALEVARSLR
jgi:hypothetical protein